MNSNLLFTHHLVLLVVAIVTLVTASPSKSEAPPTVDLGYEIHQGWFNVRLISNSQT